MNARKNRNILNTTSLPVFIYFNNKFQYAAVKHWRRETRMSKRLTCACSREMASVFWGAPLETMVALM